MKLCRAGGLGLHHIFVLVEAEARTLPRMYVQGSLGLPESGRFFGRIQSDGYSGLPESDGYSREDFSDGEIFRAEGVRMRKEEGVCVRSET